MASLSSRKIETNSYTMQVAPAIPRQSPVVVPSKISSKEKVKWLITILACCSIGIFVDSQYSTLAKVNLQIERQKLAISQLSGQNSVLKDQVASLQTPERLLKIATDKLHMVPAEQAAQGTNK